MRRAQVLALALVVLAGCDQRALQVTGCAVADEKLSAAFRNPAKTRAYLGRLSERLKDGDGAAVREAADIIDRIGQCLE